jgi:glycosyltransferase involved in cell wall biosynthesis
MSRTSWLQLFPGVARYYRSLLPLMPAAARSLDLRGFDVVLSISHAVAKGVRTHRGQRHLCLCLSPMRYAWDLREQYLEETGLGTGTRRWLADRVLDRVQRWDRRSSSRVDAFASISRYIADRVRRAYGRESEIIYPPVDVEFFTPDDAIPERGRGHGALPGFRLPGSDFYVTASRFVPYKRVDLIARAFAEDGRRKLVVVGDGPDASKVRSAAGANVTLLGRRPREVLRDCLRRARAFVFAAEEDFGIAPVEAMACGTPVIAYGRGGVVETVRPLGFSDPSGLFFEEQTTAAIRSALDLFERRAEEISSAACRGRAEQFSASVFRDRLAAFVARHAA